MVIVTLGDAGPVHREVSARARNDGRDAVLAGGVGAPRNTPTEVIHKLNNEINAGLADPKIRTRLANVGAMVLANSPAEFGNFIADETEKWAKVVRFSGAKPD